jgi:hypothetical protein
VPPNMKVASSKLVTGGETSPMCNVYENYWRCCARW